MDGVMGCEAHARCAQGRKWQGCGLCSATAWVGLEWGQGSVFGFFFGTRDLGSEGRLYAGGLGVKSHAVGAHLELLLLVAFHALVGGLLGDLFVVFLHGSKILTGLAELSLFHTLSDVPVDEGTLGVHKVEFVVHASHDFGDSRRVRDHENRALDLGEVTAGHDSRGLVVDSDLETGRAPVDEADGSFRLDGSNGSVHVLGHNVTAVHKTARHVLAVTRVALNHLVRRLEDRVGNLSDGQELVVGNLGGDDRRERAEREVDPRVGHKVGLELREVDVQGAVETEGRGDRGDALGQQSVEVRVRRALDSEVPAADVVQGLVVNHERDVGVLHHRVGAEAGVVGLDHSRRDLRGRVDGELNLRLLAVVNRQPLKEQRAESRSGTATEGVVQDESLETSAVVRELANPVENEVDDLLAD